MLYNDYLITPTGDEISGRILASLPRRVRHRWLEFDSITLFTWSILSTWGLVLVQRIDTIRLSLVPRPLHDCLTCFVRIATPRARYLVATLRQSHVCVVKLCWLEVAVKDSGRLSPEGKYNRVIFGVSTLPAAAVCSTPPYIVPLHFLLVLAKTYFRYI